MTVYVLHFDPPYKHAKHYIGYAENVKERFECHLKGNGNPLVRAAVEAGCKISLAHVFEGADRTFERRIKSRRDVCKWCKLCGRKERTAPKWTNEN
jgi:predicted GIY-YIG superfamily endonuclease